MAVLMGAVIEAHAIEAASEDGRLSCIVMHDRQSVYTVLVDIGVQPCVAIV